MLSESLRACFENCMRCLIAVSSRPSLHRALRTTSRCVGQKARAAAGYDGPDIELSLGDYDL